MPGSAAAPPLKQIALGDLEHELATTRRVLERVPDEHLDWKPHEKSWSIGDLAQHIANLLRWQVITLRQDEFDLAAPPRRTESPASRDAILRSFDENLAEVRRALEETDDAALRRPWTLRRGEQVILQRPRVAVMRGMGISHIVHHRGQLSVYLRLLDVPVPSVYGPSADEGSGF